jgi:hypothetical protein
VKFPFESLKERKREESNSLFPSKGAIGHHLAFPSYFYHLKHRLEARRMFSETQNGYGGKEVVF